MFYPSPGGNHFVFEGHIYHVHRLPDSGYKATASEEPFPYGKLKSPAIIQFNGSDKSNIPDSGYKATASEEPFPYGKLKSPAIIQFNGSDKSNIPDSGYKATASEEPFLYGKLKSPAIIQFNGSNKSKQKNLEIRKKIHYMCLVVGRW